MTTTENTTTDHIALKVREIIIYKLGLDESMLTDNAEFKKDLEVDSLDMMELQIEIENVFMIDIPSEASEKLTTIISVINFVKQTAISYK